MSDGSIVTGRFLSVIESARMQADFEAILQPNVTQQEVEDRLRDLLGRMGLAGAADEILSLPTVQFDEAMAGFFAAAGGKRTPPPPPA